MPRPFRLTCHPNAFIPVVTQRTHLVYLLFPALLLLAQSLHAQTPDAVASFDSGYVETGNPFVLHLSVPGHLGQPSNVDFSPWETLLPTQNILGATGWQNRNDRWTNDISLITFDSAQLWLPPLGISLSDGTIVQTNPLELNVLPTPAPDELAEMHSIKDIRLEQANWTDFLLPFGIIGAAVLVLALAVWWFLLRKKKSGLMGERVLRLPPHQLALRQLAELERRQYWQQGAIKIYYSELSRIVREYLEHRLHVPALESDSEGILHLLADKNLPEPLLHSLSELLHWADLAKFAKAVPPEHFHAQALREARRLVEQTRPREVAESPVNEPANY